MRINETDFHMTVNRRRVISTTIEHGRIKLNWHCEEWANWAELMESAELRTLIETANSKISQAKTTTKGKGDGKGNPAGTGQ